MWPARKRPSDPRGIPIALQGEHAQVVVCEGTEGGIVGEHCGRRVRLRGARRLAGPRQREAVLELAARTCGILARRPGRRFGGHQTEQQGGQSGA